MPKISLGASGHATGAKKQRHDIDEASAGLKNRGASASRHHELALQAGLLEQPDHRHLGHPGRGRPPKDAWPPPSGGLAAEALPHDLDDEQGPIVTALPRARPA